MSWVLAFLGFCALIVLHEAGHFAAAKAVGMRVERFALFFPPMLFTVRRGETEYGVGSIPLGGYVRISGMNPYEELPPDVEHRAYYRQPPWKRIVVILAGPAVNFLIAFVIFWALLATQDRAGDTTNRLATVSSSSAAAAVLLPGDRLLAVDGQRGDVAQLRARISAHRCAGGSTQANCSAAVPARLTVLRDGREATVRVAPRYDAQAGRMLVGVGFDYERLPAYGVVEGAGQSVVTMWDATSQTVQAIVRLVYSSRARSQISGVVGSYETTRQTIERSGFAQTMSVLALISLSLAVINLFPFLPLDGGHVLWAVVEKLRGEAVPFKLLERVSLVGFALVAVLFVIGLSNDIGTLQDGGFSPP